MKQQKDKTIQLSMLTVLSPILRHIIRAEQDWTTN